MHQLTVPVGKSAKADIVIGVGVALATAVPALSVGINIGNNTGKPWGILEREFRDEIDRCIREARQGVAAGVILRLAHSAANLGQGKAGVVVDAGTNALAAETGICSIRNTTGNLDGQTEMIEVSFEALMREARQQVFMGAFAGVVK